jgi:hypothetical protein
VIRDAQAALRFQGIAQAFAAQRFAQEVSRWRPRFGLQTQPRKIDAERASLILDSKARR